MKLSKEEADQFYNIISTCSLAGIEHIVFQDKGVGIASSIRQGYCAIIVRNNVPPIIQKMGLTRLGILKKRLDLLMSDALEITLKESDRGEIIQIEMISGKTKTQYRCTSSSLLKAPGTISDGGLSGILTISKEELTMILNGSKAMGADQIMMIVKQDGTTSLEVTDSNDRFTVELDKPIERVEAGESDSVVFCYETGIFSTLLRAALGNNDSLSLAIGTLGTIQFELNDSEMSIFAQIDGDTND